MEQTTDKQAHAAPSLTREEFWRRWEEHKRKKQALIKEIEQDMAARIKARTGEEVTSFEVW